ncbi:MAG: DNA photolyase FAD-binding protein [Rhizobiaceae bacterium]|nr:DNA photolyase FAD-binding protein [Rhizobiaceae bacterium]
MGLYPLPAPAPSPSERSAAAGLKPLQPFEEPAAAFPGTRAEALLRVGAFLPRAGRHYAAGRNTDQGPGHRSDVSILSPYLRHRLLTEREVVERVLAVHGPREAEKFIHEVLWRTYWKGWLELRPAVWERFLDERDATRAGAASGLAKALARAEAGETGIDGFDDWAKEITDTGYLHNHARMWFASIWIFTLRLPWTLGADFFLRNLLDADPASNTLSWRWVAGLQTTGKTYLATKENIARFTEGRFSPKGLAETAEPLREETALPAAKPIRPTPPVPAGKTLLLMTGEDLHPESAFPKGLDIAGIATATRIEGTRPWPFGDKAGRFLADAMADAASRAEAHFGTGPARMGALDAPSLLTAAKACGATSIVTPETPVGPVASTLASLAPELSAAGIPLVRVRRDWDSRFWPHATKGFFPFRERISALLREEGLPG